MCTVCLCVSECKENYRARLPVKSVTFSSFFLFQRIIPRVNDGHIACIPRCTPVLQAADPSPNTSFDQDYRVRSKLSVHTVPLFDDIGADHCCARDLIFRHLLSPGVQSPVPLRVSSEMGGHLVPCL